LHRKTVQDYSIVFTKVLVDILTALYLIIHYSMQTAYVACFQTFLVCMSISA